MLKSKKKPSEISREQKLKQIETINRLATRLPWIVLVISLFAFALIFIQVYFFAK